MFGCINAAILSLNFWSFTLRDGMELKLGNTQGKIWQNDFMELQI